jgi:hypothetical protein
MKEYINILKKFMDVNYIIHVDEYNNLVSIDQIMIPINEEIPTYIKIKFDMPYCLLCKEIHIVPKIHTSHHSIQKTYEHNKQPYICFKCYDIIELIKIKSPISDNINFNGNIMELTLITKKFSILIFGFKYDENSIVHMLVPDILKIIINLYITSINF